jgi:catechol 2,3-dioxygenase
MPGRKLISQLAHVEITTPNLEESTRFFVDVLGLSEVARVGGSVYLRCWYETFHSSIILTPGDQPGVAHVAWRAQGPEELEIAVQRLEEDGSGKGWIEESVGHGRAYQFISPGGGLNEIFWDVERYQAPEDQKSTFPERPQRFSSRGVGCRQIDHITMPTKDVRKDVAWYRDVLGFRFTSYQVLDDNPDHMFFAMLTVTEQSHTLGLLHDEAWVPGRVHHVAFWLDNPLDLRRAVDVVMEAGTPIEYGPGRHGEGENDYLYFREPGNFRIELFSGGYRNYEPDIEPVCWRPLQGPLEITRNNPAPPSMLEAFPPKEQEITVETGVDNPWTLEGVS